MSVTTDVFTVVGHCMDSFPAVVSPSVHVFLSNTVCTAV